MDMKIMPYIVLEDLENFVFEPIPMTEIEKYISVKFIMEETGTDGIKKHKVEEKARLCT